MARRKQSEGTGLGLKRQLAAMRGSEFLRDNAIFFVGSGAVSVLNYLYYPLLGRLMDPSGFGEVQTLVSLFTQIAIFFSVLGMLTVNIVANSRPGDEAGEARAQRTIAELEKLALAISLIGLLLVTVGSPLLRNFFNFQSLTPFVILAVALVVSVPATFRTAYLRGKKQFGANSVEGIIASAAKLGFSALLIILGFGTAGAIAGLVAAQAVAFVYAAYKARQAGYHQPLLAGLLRRPDLRLLLPELRFAGLVLAVSLAMTVLWSADVLFVKHHFDAHDAGLYAGVATVARIILFLTGSIAQVLLPSVRLENTAAENYQVLRKSTILLVGIGGAALLVFWFAPRLVIGLLMGSDYLEYASLLPRLSLAIFVVSVINLFMLYHLALRRYAAGAVAVAGAAVTCLLIAFNNSTLAAVVDSLLYGSLVFAVLLGKLVLVALAGWA